MSLRSAYKRALLREVWILKNTDRKEMSALLYFVDYLMKLPKDKSEQLQQEMRKEIRKEDEMMLDLYKEDLPPTLAGILEMERQEGIEIGREQATEQVIRHMIVSLIENGITDKVIAQATKQTIEQVQAIRSEMELK